MKSIINFHIGSKNTFAKIVMAYFLILLAYRFYSSTFLVFAVGQPMKGPEMDYAFWISHSLGFPHFIIQHYWAALFVDIGVVVFACFCVFSDNKRWLFSILLILFFFVQRMTIETYACSHSKSMSAVFIAILPFCFKKETNFQLAAEFSRYFLIYIMCASAFYKLYNGALLDPQNFAVTLVNQHTDLATLNPGHLCYQIANYLIVHPAIAGIAYVLLFICQAVFFAGWFTKKYDTLLFILLLLFSIFTYLIMRIYNFDILVLGLYLFYNRLNETNEY